MAAKYSEFNKRFGASLQAHRKARGFKSANAFADYLGINRSTYTDYEQGKTLPSYARAWELADALEVTLDALGGREFHAEEYSDDRQQQMNYDFESLDDQGKDMAAAAVRGIAASCARAASPAGATPDQRTA